MTAIDSRRALAATLAETRAIMDQSAAKAHQRVSRREIVARLMAADSVPRALPAPERATMAPEPVAQVIDLTGISLFTERALSEITGASLAAIAKAVQRKSIRVIRRKGQSRLLNVASTARWLQHAHGISPEALLDITQE